jgi:hypothetical protein
MTPSFLTALSGLAAVLLATSACHPDQPATQPPAEAPTTAPAAAPGTAAGPTDTLHLPGGQVVQLRPTTLTAFNHLVSNSLYDMPNDPAAENLAATQGRVRRQGLQLLLQPVQDSAVRLTSTATEAALQNGGVNYQYWGSLPAAHQWVVRAWYWEASGMVLVDQRTGRHLELVGDPVASPDGRRVLLTSPGLGGGDQANMLSLVEIADDGPRLRWQREPTAWEPMEVRWANPGLAVMKLRHLNAQGEMPDDAPESYVQLVLPRY